REIGADLRDVTTAHSHIRSTRRRPGAVDDRAAFDQQTLCVRHVRLLVRDDATVRGAAEFMRERTGSMKKFLATGHHGPIDPAEGRQLGEASLQWLPAHLADGTLDCVYSMKGGGRIVI